MHFSMNGGEETEELNDKINSLDKIDPLAN
jgi:hypothetical protein